jgi:TonB family protein
MRRPLLASLALHALGIALLFTMPAADQPRAHFGRLTAIASPYRGPMLVKPKPPVHPLGTSEIAARTFRVPDRFPRPAPPRLNTAIPDPPILPSPEVRSAYSAPPLIELPPLPPLPPVRRAVIITGAFDVAMPLNQGAALLEITTGAFGDAGLAVAGSRSSKASDPPISSTAEILSKPRPAYTDEARHLKIEGEVLLEVLFSASGETRVLRTIRGLGHGLDENAITAARAIQFRPAKRGDTAVDSTAVLHIVFQLAY